MVLIKKYSLGARTLMVLVLSVFLLSLGQDNIMAARALGVITPRSLVDQTPIEPLTNPSSATYSSRYLSGFGEDNSFTVFFENRDASSTITHVSTTQGVLGFPASVTATNIQPETHFLVKD
jgi:hypothetical protein